MLRIDIKTFGKNKIHGVVMSVASYLNWKRSLMSEGERNSALGIIPVRYSVPRGTIEYEYCFDLDLSEDAVKWRDAIEFTFAGKPPRAMCEFWERVREEYLRSGGRMKETEPQEIVFD